MQYRILVVLDVQFKLDKFRHTVHQSQVCSKVAEALEALRLKVVVQPSEGVHHKRARGYIDPIDAAVALLAIDLRDNLRTLLAGSTVAFNPEDFRFRVGQMTTTGAGTWRDSGYFEQCTRRSLTDGIDLTFPTESK